MISFAGGLPAPEYFPAEQLAAATARVMATMPGAALQYGPTEGYRPLRTWIAEQMARLEMPALVEQVLITSGSQQGLDLLGKLLLDSRSAGSRRRSNLKLALTLSAWRPDQPRFVPLPMDEQGLEVGALAQALEGGERPRFLYIVSSFQNPTGVSLSIARRKALLELRAAHGLPIIEKTIRMASCSTKASASRRSHRSILPGMGNYAM